MANSINFFMVRSPEALVHALEDKIKSFNAVREKALTALGVVDPSSTAYHMSWYAEDMTSSAVAAKLSAELLSHREYVLENGGDDADWYVSAYGRAHEQSTRNFSGRSTSVSSNLHDEHVHSFWCVLLGSFPAETALAYWTRVVAVETARREEAFALRAAEAEKAEAEKAAALEEKRARRAARRAAKKVE